MLKEPGPEQPGSPTLFVKAHGFQQLSVTFPQDVRSPFPSNQVLGTVLSVLGEGWEGGRAKRFIESRGRLARAVATVKFCSSVSPLTVGFPRA